MMMPSRFLTILTGLAFAALGNKYGPACRDVEAVISNKSKVYYPGNPLYAKGKSHFALSSQQSPACVVEPGTPEDVGKILKVIDATKTPFAVKSGGHIMNPGFSSTEGIHIYTGKFSQVTYDAASNTAVIGSGLIWDTVYKRLEDRNVSVAGGRATGVGVGGLLLGGGYSFKTNQFGLSIDTIVGFNLVLPNGTVTYVTQSTHPDLFFGLKGGFNNFGIVTDFTMTTFPQTKVWGGQVTYPIFNSRQFRRAFADFSAHSKDPKAAILPSFVSYLGIPIISQTIFYDGPTPPPGTFDNFTRIPSISSDLKTRPYSDMMIGSNSTAGLRGSFHMVGVSRFSDTFLKAVEDELEYWTAELALKSGIFFSYSPEPFLPNYLSHANSPSAWPTPSARQAGKAPNPLFIYFGWGNALHDDEFVAAVEESARRLAGVAEAEGLHSNNPLALYGNYVNAETPLADIYGDNLPRLQALKAELDPTNVMGLAGGFKFDI